MKRFTETTKWSDPWFRRLSPAAKCLWAYLCDNCDNAGVIQPDLELVAFQIGETVQLEELGDRVACLECGKVVLRGFIEFQYGTLSGNTNFHKKAIKDLERSGLTVEAIHNLFNPTSTLHEGLPNPTGRVQEEEEVQEEEKEEVQEKVKTPRKSKAKGSAEEIEAYCVEQGLPPGQGKLLFDKWEGNGWVNGTNRIKDWRATVRTWKGRKILPYADPPNSSRKPDGKPYTDERIEIPTL